jgi:hypothetical protein
LFYLACAAEEEEGFWNRFELEWSAVSWVRVTLKITIGSDGIHVQISRRRVGKGRWFEAKGVISCTWTQRGRGRRKRRELVVASIAHN